MAERRNFLPPPQQPGGTTPEALFRHAQQVATALRQVMQGGLNIVADLALTTGTATVIEDPRLTVQGVLLLDPLTAPAAAALGAGTVFVAAEDRNNGRWTVTHPAGGADRLFRVVILG